MLWHPTGRIRNVGSPLLGLFSFSLCGVWEHLISSAFMEWDSSTQRLCFERGGIRPSEDLQNSPDGMLTQQGRNWRQSSLQLLASTKLPEWAPRALCWTLLPVSSPQRQGRSKPVGKVSFPGKDPEQGSTAFMDSQDSQSPSDWE